MSIEEKIRYLWSRAYERALGCLHADPCAYANAQVSSFEAHLLTIKRRQAHPNGLAQRGSRAGRRQAALRMGA